MPYLTQLAKAARRTGYPVTEVAGWKTRGHGPQPEVDGVVCLEGDTVVLTRRGLIALRDVVVGDEVWTHRQRWRPVTATQRIPDAQILRLRAPGVDIRCTPDHRWLTPDGWMTAEGASELLHGIPAMPPEDPPNLPDGSTPSPELLRVVGAWVADGTVVQSPRGRPRLRLNPGSHKASTICEWLDAAGLKWGRYADNTNAAVIDLRNKALTGWVVEHFGERAWAKRIPAWLFSAPKHAGEFVEGFLHGDGNWATKSGGRDHWIAVTTSRSLAIGIVMLARQADKHAYIAERRPRTPGEINGRSFLRRESWIFRIFDSPPDHQRKSDLRYDRGPDIGAPVRLAAQYGSEDVYDITVDEDHSFLADGLWSHNCHHTAGWNDMHVVRDGRPGLDGPLSQIWLRRDGRIFIVAAGRCWHNAPSLSLGHTNSRSIGIEAENDGRTPWPPEQLDSYKKLCAELCREFGLPVSTVKGHKEVNSSKPDPHSINMTSFRKDVARLLKGEPSAPGATISWTENLLKDLPLLKPGDDNYDVKTARGLLNARGYLPEAVYAAAGLKEWLDRTKYDDELAGLVRGFQRIKKLDVDGLIGEDTWRALARVS